jgi:hypothetical protein
MLRKITRLAADRVSASADVSRVRSEKSLDWQLTACQPRLECLPRQMYPPLRTGRGHAQKNHSIDGSVQKTHAFKSSIVNLMILESEVAIASRQMEKPTHQIIFS